jgi:uncharacterized membrane protein
MKRTVHLLIVAALLLIALAGGTMQAQQPVVYGVFFYSPSCGHCHIVINDHWPQIQAEFGDQLRVLFVNVQTGGGNALMNEARAALGIESGGVPMLLLGEHVLIGSVDIPGRAPEIIRTGLDNGGIALPDVPGLQALYDQAVAAEAVQAGEPEAAAPVVEELTLAEKLAADPVANTLAIAVLVLLVGSLLLVGIAGIRALQRRDPAPLRPLVQRFALALLALLAVIGLGLSISLAVGDTSQLSVVLVAVAVLAIFLFAGGVILLRAAGSRPLPVWLLPLLALAGLIVAAYLAYVEVTLADAVCGLVGNCNTVQQSEYARILNIPIGVLGVLGYVLIFGLWVASRGKSRWTRWALLLVTAGGVAFSAYLTFLEPFVIGATCVWCLTSAVVMLMLFWVALAQALPTPATPSDGRTRGFA